MAEYWGGDIPWIGIRDATQNHGHVIYDTANHTNELGIANSSARLLPAHTVCLSRTASVGYVVVMGRPMATSQDFVNWVCSEQIDWRLLKYVLLAEMDSLVRFAHGTTHQTIYFPEVKAFHVCLPPLDEQRRIAGVLGALDAKIERNVALVRRLLDVARVRYEQLADSALRVDEVSDLAKGLSYKGAGLAKEGIPMFNLANFNVGSWAARTELKYYVGDYRDRHVVSSGDLLVSNTDLTQRREILGRPLLVPDDFHLALFTHHVYALRFKEGGAQYRLPLFFALQTSKFRDRAMAFASGTTVAALPRDAILEFDFPTPIGDRLDGFNHEAQLLINRAWAAERESVTLTTIRDALLPKLVSGKIRVPESYDPGDALGTLMEEATSASP